VGAREFDLIARIRARAGETQREDIVLGIGDDAALLQVPPGQWLVVATDTLNAGVHFPEGTAPADIGWKALAVNLSDLAAMGAQPAWCTLSLSLPEGDADWIDAFLDGFVTLANIHGIALVGGDMTAGPLSVCVTVHGFVESDRALRRDRAHLGDDVWVSGTLGDAAAAIVQLRAGAAIAERFGDRLDRPTPRIALGRELGAIANAAIDVSDGLLADLGHVCVASGCGAEVDVDVLPASDALLATFEGDARRHVQAAGGDDYELCFTAPPWSREAIEGLVESSGLRITRIGRIVAGHGVQALDAHGAPWVPPATGYVHFEGEGA
jgi:thiamine-monophosphate kinase